MDTSSRDLVLGEKDDLQIWTWPEEDRWMFTSVPWDGQTYRWFRHEAVLRIGPEAQKILTGRAIGRFSSASPICQQYCHTIKGLPLFIARLPMGRYS